MIMNLPKNLLLVLHHEVLAHSTGTKKGRLCKIGFKMQLGRTDTTQRIILHSIGCWERASVHGAACHVDPICGKITTWSSYRIFLKLLCLLSNKKDIPMRMSAELFDKGKDTQVHYYHDKLPSSSSVPMSLSCSQGVHTAQHSPEGHPSTAMAQPRCLLRLTGLWITDSLTGKCFSTQGRFANLEILVRQ